jgi:serine/threonine protein kinase
MPEPTQRVELSTDLFKVTSEAPSATGGAPTQAEMLAPIPANQLRPGERIADFLILRVLGEGSFATVYLAHDVALDRRVALKVSERRGLGEGQALAELEHEHIVQVHAQFTDVTTGKHCLCLQYVAGTTLAGIIERLHRRGRPPTRGQDILDAISTESHDEIPFDPLGLHHRGILSTSDFPAAVCRLGAQLAGALHFAHRRGVLHCDVKPANVLVNLFGRPLLADFNVSVDADKTRPGKGVGGTIAYMAPEQLALFMKEGTGRVDERCDVYSLGVVLFELLTGQLPFEPARATSETAYNREQLRLQRGFDRTVSWEKYRLPPVLERVLRRCLDPDPERRYADAAELARALANAFEILTLAKSMPPGRRLTHWAERWPVAMLVVLTLLPQLAGSIVNIAYNTIQIKFTPEQQAAFHNVVLGYNAIVYPIGVYIVVRLMLPLVRAWRRLPSSGAMSDAEIDELRHRALTLGAWLIIVALAGWLPGGIMFPLLIDLQAGSVSWEVYTHFMISFAVAGLVAMVYSHFGIQFIMLRVFYLRLSNADSRDQVSTQKELAAASRWLTPFQYLTLVPLVGAILLLVAIGDASITFRLIVAGIISLAFIGVLIAMEVTRRLHGLVRLLGGESGESPAFPRFDQSGMASSGRDMLKINHSKKSGPGGETG